MRRFAGQAARHTGRLAHALAQLVFALVITAAVLIAGVAWRLSQGPLDLPWLAARLQQAIALDTSAHLTLGSAALAWEGFTGGVDRPLDIRVTQVVVADATGKRLAAIPRAEVSLSASQLLLGRIVPRAIEVDGARLRVLRDEDGAVTLDLGGLLDKAELPPGPGAPSAQPGPGGLRADLLREFLRPAVGDHARARLPRWSQLRRVRVRDASVSVTDRQLGAAWGLRALTVDLTRGKGGGVTGRADAGILVGGQTAHLGATASLDRTTGRTTLAASLGALVPAKLASDIRAAAALAPLDLPVELYAAATLDPAFAPQHLTLRADLGRGALRLPTQETAVFGAVLQAEGTPEKMALTLHRLDVAPTPDGRHTVLEGHADLTRTNAGDIDASATLDLDAVAFADLPALWPAGVGGPGTRPWITANITDGMARNGHVDLGLHIPADLSGVDIRRVEGGIDGTDLTVHWLRPVPPVEDATARLSFAGADSLVVTVTGGRQAGGSQGGVRIQGGRVVFTGLNDPDQFADIEADLAGPVPDLLTLLRSPRVRLLEKSPLPVKDAAGQIAGKVVVTHLPLRDTLSMDDVDIRTTAKLTGLRLVGIAAGHDIDQGDFSLEASAPGLRATGTARVAGLPAQMQLDLDFRAGPPSQVLQRVSLAGTVTAAQLAPLGLDTSGVLSGPLALQAKLAVRRDHAGEAQITADLSRATLAVAPLGYAKPPGEPGSLAVTLHLAGDRIASVDPIRVDATGARLVATASFAGGQPDRVTVQQLRLGDGTDLHGAIQVPRRPGDPWRVTVNGASLDAASQFAHQPASGRPAKRPPEPPPGPPYVAETTFGRVLLGKGRAVTDVVAHVESDGRVMRRASVTGRTPGAGGGTPFRLAITPQDGGRALSLTTSDAGALLRAFDIEDKMQGGRMAITGRYDDRAPGHPLTGTAEIQDFRIHDAPMLGKLLQAMTLYGLVEVVRGPGLGFTRLEAPFHLADDLLELRDARAFSPSLGMTAKGQVDLATRRANLTGTIVPAYFFNSLLGDLPLIGRLFSPEPGGGLFAATYSVTGSLDNPDVSVNPLAALTPGFLRGVFGIFDTDGRPTKPPVRPSK